VHPGIARLDAVTSTIATEKQLGMPCGIVGDLQHLYIVDGNTLKRIQFRDAKCNGGTGKLDVVSISSFSYRSYSSTRPSTACPLLK
jgi:hypothetical protein